MHSSWLPALCSPCRCGSHPPGPFSWGPPFPVRLQPSIQLQSQHQPDATGPLAGKGSASTHIFHLLSDKTRVAGGRNKGSSSSASPSAFIANNLLSVCDAAVLPLFPWPSFSPAQMGFTRRRRGRGSARKGRSGALSCDRSDPEVFLRLMNGTFEVFSLAWCPKPASPVVGVNWPVVWHSGTVPGSLPDNLVSVAAQSRATITSTSKPSINSST